MLPRASQMLSSHLTASSSQPPRYLSSGRSLDLIKSASLINTCCGIEKVLPPISSVDGELPKRGFFRDSRLLGLFEVFIPRHRRPPSRKISCAEKFDQVQQRSYVIQHVRACGETTSLDRRLPCRKGTLAGYILAVRVAHSSPPSFISLHASAPVPILYPPATSICVIVGSTCHSLFVEPAMTPDTTS